MLIRQKAHSKTPTEALQAQFEAMQGSPVRPSEFADAQACEAWKGQDRQFYETRFAIKEELEWRAANPGQWEKDRALEMRLKAKYSASWC